MHGQHHEGAAGIDIFKLSPLGQLGRFHQVLCIAEIVDPLVGDHAAGKGRLILLEESSADEKSRIGAAGSGNRIGIGIDLRVVERLRLPDPGVRGLDLRLGFLNSGMLLQAYFDGLPQGEKFPLQENVLLPERRAGGRQEGAERERKAPKG